MKHTQEELAEAFMFMSEQQTEMKYPKISGVRKYKGHPNGHPACSICGRKATCRVEIQTSPFRGDDEYSPRCDEHKNALSLDHPMCDAPPLKPCIRVPNEEQIDGLNAGYCESDSEIM